MKSIRSLLLLTLLLVSTEAVNASPKLSTRQEFWDDVDSWGILQKTIDTGAGVISGFGDWIFSTWDQERSPPQQQNRLPNPQPPPGNPNNQPSQSPDINLQLANHREPGKRFGFLTSSQEADKSCGGPTTDSIVYSSSCAQIDRDIAATNEDKTRNQAITQQLTRMNALNTKRGASGLGLRIAMSDTCDVVIWALSLDKQQVREVEKLAGVIAVDPNRPIGTSEIQSSHLIPPKLELVPSQKKFRNKKRQQLEMVFDEEADEDLRFISTPRAVNGLEASYSYHQSSGKEIRVFILSPGVTRNHKEFRRPADHVPVIEDVLLTQEAFRTETDTTHYGTCVISKVGGLETGVVKNALLVPVKFGKTEASVIEAFSLIVTYLKALRIDVVGYHVVVMDVHISTGKTLNAEGEPTPDLHILSMVEKYLKHLYIKYGTVIVVTAGGVPKGTTNTEIDTYPAALAEFQPIITVGAVNTYDGQAYPWSKGRPGQKLLKISAPGFVTCAGPDPKQIFSELGGHVAAAQVGGLAAYFLSHPAIGYKLRANSLTDPASVPERVEELIMQLSYSRTKRLPDQTTMIPGPRAIYNWARGEDSRSGA